MQFVDPKFKNKYRIPSNRLPGYDYSSTGLYFITVCTKNREKYFGYVKYGMMELSAIGEIVKEELLKTGEIRPNINIDEWVIMPNHVHVIVGIDNQANEKQFTRSIVVETSRWDVSRQPETRQRRVSTTNEFRLYPNSLGAIINHFKSSCTKRIRQFYISFAWQPRFHDHIIRDDGSLTKIRQYILDNPIKWREDELFVK